MGAGGEETSKPGKWGPTTLTSAEFPGVPVLGFRHTFIHSFTCLFLHVALGMTPPSHLQTGATQSESEEHPSSQTTSRAFLPKCPAHCSV